MNHASGAGSLDLLSPALLLYHRRLHMHVIIIHIIVVANDSGSVVVKGAGHLILGHGSISAIYFVIGDSE